MKMIFRMIGGLLYFMLLLLRPIFMVISMLSSRILSVAGIILIILGILIFMSEGLADRTTTVGIILSFVLGSLSMLAGPFIIYLDEWYEELHERLGEFVFNKEKNKDDFLM
ncbi:MAG: hypothetical protein IJ471_09215 [Eubacterium sp.]|nr:hypothetical protein [Eubacterium sp.]